MPWHWIPQGEATGPAGSQNLSRANVRNARARGAWRRRELEEAGVQIQAVGKRLGVSIGVRKQAKQL